MRIQSSNIEMYGQSHKQEELKIHNQRIKEEKPDIALSTESPILDIFDVEVNAKSAKANESNRVESSQMYEMSEEDYQKVKMLESMLSFITGKEVKFILPKRLEVTGENGQVVNSAIEDNRNNKPYMRRRVEYKREQSMSFEATGYVRTDDGREIAFDLKMNRSEKIQFKEEVTLNKNGKVIDPLVINYNGNLTNLTREKYSFDLDFDGASDQISFLEKGSGYLAFDRDENGHIDDGRELFGPSTGDGFKELARYDEDGNGFIDEGDSIFDKLRIWNKDESGKDVLFALGEVGVGAIYLGNVATDYALGNGPMAEDGFIRSTGLFIKESGGVGSVNHVDLTL